MKLNKLFKATVFLPLTAFLVSCVNNPINHRLFRDEEHPEDLVMNDVETQGQGTGHLCPSTGDTRVLVIPISFKDFPAGKVTDIAAGKDPDKDYHDQTKGLIYRTNNPNSASGKTEEEKLAEGAKLMQDDIRKAYFGTPEETQWYSLSEYYKRSSYGKQNFNGIVLPWKDAFTDSEYRTPVTAREFVEGGGKAATLIAVIYDTYVSYLYKKVTNPITKKPFESGEEFAQYFDSNKDGCVDVVEVVYSCPFHVRDAKGVIDDEVFWAYCGSSAMSANVKKPKISKWAWQSYYTFYEPGYNDENDKHQMWTQEEIAYGKAKVDAHTLIHETGHAQGLPDYYDYDNKKQPAGCVDMMDHNIGDHNAYSKSLYGWSNPYVVTGSTKITVNSFTETGDCILIAYRGYWDEKNERKNKNTLYNEYIMIELYTPTGVNEYDTTHSYAGMYPFTPSKVGLKVWHVDSRLGLFTYPSASTPGDSPSSNEPTFNGHVDYIVAHNNYQVVKCAADNTGSRSYDKKVDLLKFLPNKEHSMSGKKGICDDTLWKQGDAFGVNKNYEGFRFNTKVNDMKKEPGIPFGYTFTVDEIVENGAQSTATISIKAI